TGTERWEEAMPPGMIDVDRNGTKDYIVFILVDEDSGRRALVARVWGDAADAFGPTVFYVIIEDDDSVSEWAGSPRLDPPHPKPCGPSLPESASPPTAGPGLTWKIAGRCRSCPAGSSPPSMTVTAATTSRTSLLPSSTAPSSPPSMRGWSRPTRSGGP